MNDQANTLRKLMWRRKETAESVSERSAQVVTVSSGKGGVGKTCFVANLGALLARSGYKVLLVDADLGLANLDIVLGVQPQATIEDILSGQAELCEAMIEVEPNLTLLPAGAGVMDARLSAARRRRIGEMLEGVCADFVIVDLGAGIQENVLSLHNPTFESIVLLTPEPTSMTDAYGLVKMLRRHASITQASVVVNQVTDGREGMATFQKLDSVVKRFIDTRLDYLGHWQRDEKISQSVMKRKILLDLDTGATSIPSLELIAKRLKLKLLGQKGSGWLPGRIKDEPAQSAPANTARFWRTLLGAASELA